MRMCMLFLILILVGCNDDNSSVTMELKILKNYENATDIVVTYGSRAGYKNTVMYFVPFYGADFKKVNNVRQREIYVRMAEKLRVSVQLFDENQNNRLCGEYILEFKDGLFPRNSPNGEVREFLVKCKDKI